MSSPPPTNPVNPRRLLAVRIALGFYWLVLIAANHWPNLTKEDVPDLGWLPFDKTMHVLTFAGLGAWLTWAKLLPRRSDKANALAAIGVGMTYGIVKEFTQPYFGRTFDTGDLVADLGGLVAGVGFAIVWCRWWSKPRSGHVHVTQGSSATNTASSETSEADRQDGQSGFVGHAALVAAFTLVSRMTGLVRDAVLAAVFGASLYLDAFLVGFIVPNLFRRLFGEGALTAAFIPRYTKLLEDDPALARRFASLCVVAVATLLAMITLVGEAGLWIALAWADTEKTRLPIALTMWMLPYMPMVCGVAFLGAILQVHKKFGPPAAAPVLLNLAMIAAALIAARQAESEWGSILVVAISVLLAGLIQIVWLGLNVLRLTPLQGNFESTREHFRGMLRTMLPMIIGLGVFQINTLLDGLIAYTLAPSDESDGPVSETFNLLGRTLEYPIESGSVTVLTLAQRLYQFPLGVFGIAIATAIFPALARAVARGRRDYTAAVDSNADESFEAIFRRGLRLTLFIGLPATVGLILVRVPLTRVFFEWKNFETADALRCAAVLAGYASAVWAYSMTHVITRAFYAVDDAMTPLKITAGMVAVNLSLNLTLIWPLGVAGLAWSTAISASVQVGLLLWWLRKHIAKPVDRHVGTAALRVLGLTLVMGGVVLAVLSPFDAAALSKTGSIGVLALAVATGGLVYLGGAWLTKMPEMRWLKR